MRSIKFQQLNWVIGCLDEKGLFSNNNVDKGGAYDLLVLGCCLYANQITQNRNIFEKIINKSIGNHINAFMQDYSFINNCNFSDLYKNTMLLHHIGYALDGLLISYEITKKEEYLELSKGYAIKLLSMFEVNLGLPAYAKKDWKIFHDINEKNHSQCLTGYAQITIVFFKLSNYFEDLRFKNAGLKILDLVCAISNREDNNKGLSFGIAGSFPFNGNYQKNQMVNWAAKYLAEAIILSENSCEPREI